MAVASASAALVRNACTGLRSRLRNAMRMDALNQCPNPARSTSEALKRAGGSGRIASAGARRMARRTAPQTPTIAARALAITATISAPEASWKCRSGNRKNRW